ncbi:hypothetical protein BS78_10G040700 [Paspalum vaginatum]|nr:hypothetical protein BS78_10G040700 [Paspalum vaginatum]
MAPAMAVLGFPGSATASALLLGRRHHKWPPVRTRPPSGSGSSRVHQQRKKMIALVAEASLSSVAGSGPGRPPLVPGSDHWGNWTFLLSTAALGIWSEQRTPVGKALSGALVSVLVGLAASSAGVVAADAPAYRVVLEYLLPLAVPLLLFRADLRRVVRSTGALLLAFLLGSAATTAGTVAAFLLVPMRSLGPDSWKVAAALMSRHIGGAVNYVAVAEALELSPSVLAAGLAADNIICALYFTTLFALAAKIPPEEQAPPRSPGDARHLRVRAVADRRASPGDPRRRRAPRRRQEAAAHGVQRKRGWSNHGLRDGHRQGLGFAGGSGDPRRHLGHRHRPPSWESPSVNLSSDASCDVGYA